MCVQVCRGLERPGCVQATAAGILVGENSRENYQGKRLIKGKVMDLGDMTVFPPGVRSRGKKPFVAHRRNQVTHSASWGSWPGQAGWLLLPSLTPSLCDQMQ